MTNPGRCVSDLEDLIAINLQTTGIDFEREYCFAPPRRWKAHFFVKPDLLIECVSFSRQSSRGFEADCYKYCQAVERGYRVLRYTKRQIESGEAIEQIARILA